MKRHLPAKAADAREIRRAWLRFQPHCEATQGAHWGAMSVHEPWTRARGGPTDDPRNMATLCVEHNRLVSQDAGWMVWAYQHGLLVRAQNGPEWLAAGGRLPGMTKDDAVQMVLRRPA